MQSNKSEMKMQLKERSSETRWLNTVSLVILAAVALAVTLIYTRKVMIPFVLALFIVSMVSPVLDFLVLKWRFPRPLAAFIAMLVVLAALALLVILIIGAVQTIVPTAGGYIDNVMDLMDRAVDWWYQKYPGQNPMKNEEVQKILNDLGKRLLIIIQSTAGAVFGLISSTVFVTIITIFLLVGRNPRLIHQGMAAEVDHKVRRYLLIKVAISAVTGVLVWITLRIIGLELASVFGMLAFLLNFIPSIGSIISTFLPVPIAVAQFQQIYHQQSYVFSIGRINIRLI
ncbi:AI-2E family transporter [Planctomycetota bacterium]